MTDYVSLDEHQPPVEFPDRGGVAIILFTILLFGLCLLFFPDTFPDYLIDPPNLKATWQFATNHTWVIAAHTIFIGAVMIVHESLHVIVHLLHGYSPSWGIKIIWSWKIPNPAPYIVVLDTPIPRHKNVIGLLTPLIVLTSIGGLGLLSPPAIVNYYAKVLLITNIAGSAGDIVNTTQVLQYHPRSIFIKTRDGAGEVSTLVYEPKS